jgi:hypothetical protein
MKNLIFLFCAILLLASCTKEAPRAHLLEFKIGDEYNSYEGFAYRYSDVVDGTSAGYDWHIYNINRNSLYIQAYDYTFTKTLFTYPQFEAVYTVELPEGLSKTYKAVSGELRLLGLDMGEFSGDFHFKLKNTINQNDSIMMNDGYFRIWLEYQDRLFSK